MKQSVILRLKGGLGNQLFQYAFGRAYAEKYNLELKLDITDYPKQTLRSYDLSHFNIKETIASDEEVNKAKYPYGFLSKLIRLFEQKVLRRYYIGFSSKLVSTPNLKYLDGFFQSEKYFISYEEIIRKEFTLKEKMSEAALEISKKISDIAMSVSLHVRRGDFVSSVRNSIFHVECSPLYYKKAMETISEKCPDAVFCVFSDDIEWVKNNIKGPNMIYISGGNTKYFEEIILMSLCKHHIIANSSFSWWGAWLNPTSDKMVISPTIWRANDIGNFKDIAPSTWIQIPNQPK